MAWVSGSAMAWSVMAMAMASLLSLDQAQMVGLMVVWGAQRWRWRWLVFSLSIKLRWWVWWWSGVLAQHFWFENQAQIYWIFGNSCGWSWLTSCCWMVVLWQWLWIVPFVVLLLLFFFCCSMYYFIRVGILFYCNRYIILL